MITMAIPRMYSVHEAAEILGVSEDFLRSRLRDSNLGRRTDGWPVADDRGTDHGGHRGVHHAETAAAYAESGWPASEFQGPAQNRTTTPDRVPAVTAANSEHIRNVWLTRPELAERLRLSDMTLANWATAGTGPRFAKFGGRVRYKLADVEAWEETQITGDGM